MSEITRSPLCWPNNVARTLPQNRRHAIFKLQTIEAATRFLLAEISRLNGLYGYQTVNGVIISSNLKLRQDGLPVSGQSQPSDPGIAVYFPLWFTRNGKRYERPCVLSCDRWSNVAYNLTAIAKDIEAQRGRQRWGCTSIEQAFQGYLAIPEKCGGQSWWELLGIPATADKATIVDRYKLLAKKHHTDVGGDRTHWDDLQNAYDQALASHR